VLNLLRENLKSLSWVLWLVIIVFVGLVFLELVQARQQGGGGAGDAAAWAADGDLKVSRAEHKRAYEVLLSQYRQILQGQVTPEQTSFLQRQALQGVIENKILAAEARRVGLKVTDKELQESILAIPILKDENGRFIGTDLYKRTVRRFDYLSIEDFEGSLRESFLIQKLQDVLNASVFVTANEVEQAYRDQVERAKIRYITLPDSGFASDVQISQEDLESYYEAQKADYSLPEQRVARYLLVDNVLLRNTLEITDEDIQNYYNANPEQFSQEEQVHARHILLRTDSRSEEEARQQMAAIRAQIEGGRDFAEVARESSEDPGSGARGGDLGLFPRGRMVPEFEEAAFSAELNQLVGPITSPFGVHLLEVTERRPAGQQPLDEVRPRVQQILVSERLGAVSEERAQDVLAKLKEAADTPAEERFQQIADELPYASLNETVPFTRGDLIPGIGRSEEFAEAAFALEEGGTSEPVKVPRGWAILQLKEIKAPRLQELAEVEPQVRQAVRAQKQKELAAARMEEARAAVTAGKSLDEVAGELSLTVQESNEFGRTGGVAGLGDSGTEVAAQALTLEVGQVGPVVQGDQGATLFQVTERKSWDPQEFEGRKEEIENGVKQQKLTRLLASLVEQRRREFNIQQDPRLAPTEVTPGQPGAP